MARSNPSRAPGAHTTSVSPALRRILLVAAIGTTAVLVACGKGAEIPLAGTATASPPGAGMPVTVVEVSRQRVPDVIESVGQTEGSRDVEVRARVSGIIEKTLYREGDRVKAGAPLFQIDRAPFENALAQARAALGQTRASLAQERAKQEQVQREAARLKQLVDQRAISQREYDDATSALKTGDALIAAADARIRDSEARIRDAELNLSYTNIAAPIGGVSGRALKSVGSLVTAGNDSALLTTISQPDPMWVRFSVGEADYAQVRAAKKPEVRVLLADGSTLPVVGKLNFTASAIDTKLGTIQLRAEFANANMALLPGQFVRVRLTIGESEAILVPQSAVVQNDQGRFVWVAGADGKAAMRPVTASSWVGRDWQIRKGLESGERVIIDNLLKLRPGAPVQPTLAAATPVPAAAPGTAPAAGGGIIASPPAVGKSN